jgi:hypothetical protein
MFSIFSVILFFKPENSRVFRILLHVSSRGSLDAHELHVEVRLLTYKLHDIE